MITTDITHIAHLVEICSRRGIKHVVLSPGSRNAPLIIAFDEHPSIKTWLIHDERCAAFFALGMAESTSEPVAIACTSGSAPLNYAPAIAEAYYRMIPLFVLTADRPVKWIDQGDGQTIRQKNVFQNFVKGSFELPDFSIEKEIGKSDAVVNLAMDVLCSVPKAPVHLNIPLSEPLYGTAELKTAPSVDPKIVLPKSLTAEEKSQIEKGWKSSPKKLILVGQLNSTARLKNLLEPVLSDPSVAILVENTSNLQAFEKIVHSIDRTLAVIKPEEIEEFKPDLLVSLGGAIISKKIKAFFRANKPAINWRVGEFLFEEDTYQSLTRSFGVSPEEFFSFVGQLGSAAETNFGDRWKQKDFFAQDAHGEYLSQLEWCDLKAFEIILNTLPRNTYLHQGNSSVIRYTQLFNPDSTIRYFSNRGVSGIDGSTTTACGFSVADPNHLHVMISGDISFFYDSNALWNEYVKSNLKIIVINNGGGGIFRILEGSSTVKQRDYFFSPYQADISKLAEAFGLTYQKAEDAASLENALNQFYRTPGDRPAILEVKTFSQNNAAILSAYFDHLRKSC